MQNFRIPNAWGAFNSEFPVGKPAKSLLGIADLLTFLVCKSSVN